MAPDIMRKEDRNFISEFLDTYIRLDREGRNLVLAFVQGMEFQRELVGGERSKLSP